MYAVKIEICELMRRGGEGEGEGRRFIERVHNEKIRVVLPKTRR